MVFNRRLIIADAVRASQSTILVGELAKLIKQNGVDMGQNRLFKWLRENGYLIKKKGADYNKNKRSRNSRGS
jgi:anti-repressor protein